MTVNPARCYKDAQYGRELSQEPEIFIEFYRVCIDFDSDQLLLLFSLFCVLLRLWLRYGWLCKSYKINEYVSKSH